MSDALKNMHDLAENLRRVGAMDAITMKFMDELCLPEIRQFASEEIREIRKKTRTSQPVFAAILGVSASSVAQWERGAKKPSGPSTRLLDLIDRKGIEALV